MNKNAKWAAAVAVLVVAGAALAFGLTRSREDKLIDMGLVVNTQNTEKTFSMDLRGRGTAGFEPDTDLGKALSLDQLTPNLTDRPELKELLEKYAKKDLPLEDWTLRFSMEPLKGAQSKDPEDFKFDVRSAAFTTLSPEELKKVLELKDGAAVPAELAAQKDVKEKDRLTFLGAQDEMLFGTMPRSGKTLLLVSGSAPALAEMAKRVVEQPKIENLPPFPAKGDGLTGSLFVGSMFMNDVTQLALADGGAAMVNSMAFSMTPKTYTKALKADFSVVPTADRLTVTTKTDPSFYENYPFKLSDAKPAAAPLFLGKGELAAGFSLNGSYFPADLKLEQLFDANTAHSIESSLQMFGVTFPEVLDMLRHNNSLTLAANEGLPTAALWSEKMPAKILENATAASAFVVDRGSAQQKQGDFTGLSAKVTTPFTTVPLSIGHYKEAGLLALAAGEELKPLTSGDKDFDLSAKHSSTLFIDFPTLWKALDHLPLPGAENWRQELALSGASHLIFSLKSLYAEGDYSESKLVLKVLPADKQPARVPDARVNPEEIQQPESPLNHQKAPEAAAPEATAPKPEVAVPADGQEAQPQTTTPETAKEDAVSQATETEQN